MGLADVFRQRGQHPPLRRRELGVLARLLTWTFKLDPKAVFSDGSPITAADVKGSWEVAAMPAHEEPAHRPGAGQGRRLHRRHRRQRHRDLRRRDPRRGDRRRDPRDARPDLLQRLANHIAPIVKVVQARGSDGNEVERLLHARQAVPVFSGPFKLTAIDIDAGKLVFEPNESFFGPKPKLARIEITTVEDNVTATR